MICCHNEKFTANLVYKSCSVWSYVHLIVPRCWESKKYLDISYNIFLVWKKTKFPDISGILISLTGNLFFYGSTVIYLQWGPLMSTASGYEKWRQDN